MLDTNALKQFSMILDGQSSVCGHKSTQYMAHVHGTTSCMWYNAAMKFVQRIISHPLHPPSEPSYSQPRQRILST